MKLDKLTIEVVLLHFWYTGWKRVNYKFSFRPCICPLVTSLFIFSSTHILFLEIFIWNLLCNFLMNTSLDRPTFAGVVVLWITFISRIFSTVLWGTESEQLLNWFTGCCFFFKLSFTGESWGKSIMSLWTI